MRRGPGVVFNTTGSLRSGDILQVLAWNNDRENPWFLVLTADQRLGWVSAEVVEADDAGALAAVPAAATLPATPFPTSTIQPSPTAPPTVSAVSTAEPGDSDPGDEPGDDPDDPEPPPTAEPTEPATEPTPTPPPLP